LFGAARPATKGRNVHSDQHREGSGKLNGPDRRRDYAIARGSAMECAAILEVIRLLSAAPNPSLDEGKGLLVRVVEMLSRMCR